MSSTNQSNSGAAAGNKQENNDPKSNMSMGAAASIGNSISNGQLQAGSTQTVYVAATSGTAQAVTAVTLINQLEKQNTIFGPYDETSMELIVIPRRCNIWAGGSTYLTAKFYDGQEAGTTSGLAVKTKQFYSIGFNGAERNEINYNWGVTAEVKPFVLGETRNIAFIEVVDPTGAGTTTAWFSEWTFTLYERTFIGASLKSMFIDLDDNEWKRKRQEEEGALKVKKIKSLTLPMNME